MAPAERQADILLTTFNARYAHAAFGLRYLLANLGPLTDRAAIVEFDLTQRTIDALEAVLRFNPKIVGLGVYIWNVDLATRFAMELKRLRPDIILVIGGPEVSYEIDQQPIAAAADYVVAGEADLAFADLCHSLLAGRRPLQKVIQAGLPEFAESARSLALPYDLYTDEDIAHRVIYVEASRGCPFKCEFCLSSLDVPVRQAPLDDFLSHMDRLLARGVRQFKFVDRTFNLNLKVATRILEFFLERRRPDLFVHFEMIPDRLPDALREPIKRFPPGALQFEVGIQTFNPDVSARISRRQDYAKLADNLTFLRNETGVHVHADLIVGLPGEDVESFAAGFDRLVALRPHEIQVGILKRLRGTPIMRHDTEWEMRYSPNPPYEILQTRSISFEMMQRLRRFSRFWDLIANSGNFVETTPKIWADGSPFHRFFELTESLHHRLGKSHSVALPRMAELVFEHLMIDRRLDPAEIASSLWRDFTAGGRRDGPEFLRPHVPDALRRAARRVIAPTHAPPRQARHQAARVEPLSAE